MSPPADGPGGRPRPPRGAVRLLRLALPADRRDDIVDELAEMFEAELARRGTSRARWWYLRQTAAFVLRFGWDRAGTLVTPARSRRSWPITRLDLAMVARSLRSTPALSLLGVAGSSVALGLGACAFSVLASLYWPEVPLPEPERLMKVVDTHRLHGYELDLTPGELADRRSALSSFSSLGGFHERRVAVGRHHDTAVPATVAWVSDDLLEMAGARAALGRILLPGDATAAGSVPVVLGHDLFVARFGADPAVLGSEIQIGEEPHRVVGVMPPGFAFPSRDEAWVPFDLDTLDAGVRERRLRALGRLAPGVTRRQAIAELRAHVEANRDLAVARGDRDPDAVSTVEPLTGVGARGFGGFAALLAGLVVVLAITSANVAQVLAARNLERSSDLALRGALGASRARLTSLLLLEGVALAGAAAVIALVGARLCLQWLRGQIADELPSWSQPSLDGRTVAFTLLLAVATAICAGLLPTRRAVAAAVGASPTSLSRRAGRGRLTALVVGQIALCVGLLAGSAGLARSLFGWSYPEIGIPAHRILVAQIYFGQPSASAAASLEPAELWRQFGAECLDRLARIGDRLAEIPEVEGVTWASQLPGNESDRPRAIAVRGSSGEDGPVPRRTSAQVVEVGPRFLDTLGIEPLAGRPDALDGTAPPAAMVNRPFAERLGEESAVLGAIVEVEGGSRPRRYEIVGVLPDLGLSPGDPRRAAGVYVPMGPTNIVRVAVRTTVPPSLVVPELYREVGAVAPHADVQWALPLDQQMAMPSRLFRALGTLLLVVGGTVVVLAAGTLFALLSHAVRRRTTEIGVRRALGAREVDVLRAILGRGAVEIAIGAVVGAGLALALARGLPAVVPFALRSDTALTIAGVLAPTVALAVTALVAPARRALRVDPQSALRADS